MSGGIAPVKEKFSQLYVTIVGVVVALGLENLVSEIRTFESIWSFRPESLLLWAQGVGIFGVLSTIWVGMSLLTINVRWTPQLNDAIAPLGLFVLVNLAIAAMGADTAHLFLYVAAFGSTVGVFNLRDHHSRVRRERQNVDVMEHALTGTQSVFQLTMGFILLIFAILVHVGVLDLMGAIIATVVMAAGQLGGTLLAFHAGKNMTLASERLAA